ncbi:MAG TPA: acyclic terpene utilization AtuA family protein [Pseudolabrys sp.]|nr:acyclic terpene utilization AtuA family protein [Pseudolabrys sp.]
MNKNSDVLRIGTGAGFAADRLDPAVDLAQRGTLDVMVLECLGERTVAFAHRDRMADPRRGYNTHLDRRMRALLPVCRDAGTTIITNMGAANPRAAAERTRDIARELGLAGLKVACIEGDDVSASVPRSQTFMDEPGTLADIGRPIVGMNAYIGADAILPALAAGADVIVGGRLADPSMYLAAIIHRHGWDTADMIRMGAGTLVGHLMECGMQITGGYFADPGVKDVPRLAQCGYPIAEVAADGSAVITKLPATGGCVTEQTVKEQLLYEVHDPAAYLTPDVTADFSHVSLETLAPDRIRVFGANGRTRPEKLKVTVGFDDGFLAEAGVSYAGPSASARGRLAGEIVAARLKSAHGIATNTRINLIGANSLFASAGKARGESDDVRLHVALRTAKRDEAELMLWEVESLLCCGPAGGGGFRGSITPAVATKSVLIDRALVKPRMKMFVT